MRATRRRPIPGIGKLEEESQSELYQSWVGAWIRAIHLSEGQGPELRIGWGKLGAIENVEELGSEFQSQFLIRTKLGSLEYRKIPIVNSGTSKCGVGSGLVAKDKVRRGSKASSIEPLIQLCA